MTRVRYAIPESHTRPPRAGPRSGPARVAAATAAGTRPDFPFPNPEAKTASADGTAPARVWESRTPPPTQTHKRGGPAPRAPPFLVPPHPRSHTRRHTHRPTRTQQAAYRQGHTTHDTRATAANRASPHSHTTPPPHNPNPTTQRTEGNQTGLARTDPLTPQPHTRKHTTHRPMRQGT